ncbi:MAG: hypothetical protein ABIK45_10700 [Pseudomonadota bacterium]
MKSFVAFLVLALLAVIGTPFRVVPSDGLSGLREGAAHAATGSQMRQDAEGEPASPGGRVVIKGRDGKVTEVERAPVTRGGQGHGEGGDTGLDDVETPPGDPGPEPENPPQQ